jgi:L-iditol 2-dehydrogenase
LKSFSFNRSTDSWKRPSQCRTVFENGIVILYKIQDSMKSMMLTGIRQMEMMDVPDPVIVNGKDVKIKMSVLGVCGSDIHYYTSGKIGSQVVKYPFTVGHEGSGVVIDIGKAVTRVKIGDQVAIEPAMPCWECDQCKSGRPHTCRKLKFLGCPGQAEGCLSEFIVMPESSCFPISPRLSPDQAAISEPLAIGVYAVKKSVPMA